MNVLIADDSALLRKNLKKLIISIDSIDSISETHSVLSTLNQLAVAVPDAIILDIELPDGTGLDVLKYLSGITPKPLTIILTNFPSDSNKQYCLDHGADYFFDKSNEYERVIQILEYYTGRQV